MVGTGRRRWIRPGLVVGAVIVVAIPIGVAMRQTASVASAPRGATTSSEHSGDAGSWASLLSLSKDLGPANVRSIDVLVTLRTSDRPVALQRWAQTQGLKVTWYAGERFAVVSGSSSSIGSALGVRVDSYRSRTGEHFYSTVRQPDVPARLSSEVTGIGRVSNYGRPEIQFSSHDFVPTGGLTPNGLIQAYNATPLVQRGMNGSGETVVFLEVSPVILSDLNKFTQKFSLPQIQLQFVGGDAKGPVSEAGEADMDIETVHEIAPQAHLVFFNVLDTPGANNNSSFGSVIALAIAAASRQFPGAIFSISLGDCERDNNAADVQGISTAAATAERGGSTIFASSGDTGGADCGSFGADSLSPAKGVELPAVAPNVTGVGGTTVSVTTNGDYSGETTWSSPMLSQGSGGGVSTIAARPSWQVGPGVGGSGVPNNREVPDVSADADPITGTAFITGGQLQAGGGTSLATPIWAGFTVLMDEFLHSQGVPPIGFANPVIYRLAANSKLSPAPFHDVTVGGNVFFQAGPGYDAITGVGSPNVAALAQYILEIEKAGT